MSNDTVNVQRGIVGAGSDDDTYVLSANLIDDNADITISDVEGANKIQLIGGLTITSSIVAGDTAQLTLSNGAVVTVLGASTMSYEVGGNPLTGTAGVTKDYATFATDVLGTTVPTTGTSTGGESTVNEDGTATGGAGNAYTLTAAAESVDEGATATFNLATDGTVAEGTVVNYTITGVDAADVDGGSLTGTATIAADGTATISVALLADLTTEGAETLTVTLDGTSVSASSTVNDTSEAATSKSFTLTTGTDSGDSFKGGDGDDTYTAAVLTANDNDSLDGGAGNDTLNLETASSITDKFVTANIETVNLNALGAVSVDVKNMAGLTTLNSNDAAGAVTVNNIASADLAVGVKGSATNSVDLNYASGVLSGSADKLSVSLNGSTSTAITADTGFESVDVKTTAASTLATLTASGATALTLSGDAALTVNNSTIDAFTDYTITNTAKVTLGTVATVKNVNASTNTGGVVGKTLSTAVDLTNGHTTDELTMHTAGGLVQTGSGDDNIALNTGSVFSTNSTIVKLGAGNDKLSLEAVSASGEYIYGEDGDDTIYVGAALTSSDLIDGGAGTDTVNFSAASHTLIAKGVEKVGVNGATTVAFVSTDTVTQIADGGADAVTFSNLLNGSTYTSTSTTGKSGDVTLGFKAAEAATVDVNLTKGTTGSVTLSNVKDATVTLGAASAPNAKTIALDSAATSLTLNVTGALTNGGTALTVTESSSTVASEKLETITVTGDKEVTLGDISNDAALTSFDLSSTGGSVTVGTIGHATNAAQADVTVSKISAASTKGGAVIGNLDFTGLSTTGAGKVETISASASGGSATSHATIGTVGADAIGSITATSTTGNATIAAITVGDDGTSTTDGTISSIKASGALTATVTSVNADNVGSIVVESTDTVTGGAASVGAITNGDGTTEKAVIGTIDITSKKSSAALASVDATQVGNITVTGATSAAISGVVNIDSATGDSTTGNISITGGTTASIGDDLTVEKAGTITLKAGTSADVDSISVEDASGQTISITAGTSIDAGTSEKIINTKGDLTVTAKAGTTYSGTTDMTIEAGTATTAQTDIDLTVDLSGVTGIAGIGADNTKFVIDNNGADANSSTVVKGAVGGNYMTINGEANSVITYTGNTGVDSIKLTGSYASSTITTESGADVIIGGNGADAVSLVETTAVTDTFTWGGSATTAAMDTLTGFTVGAGGTADDVIFSIASVKALTQATDFSDTNSTSVTAGAITLATITAATDLESAGVGNVIIANLAANIASTDALETALEVGGGLALTAGAAGKALVAGDTFLVAYDNGVDTFIAAVSTTAGATDTTFAAGDLTATNLVKLAGVSDVTTLVAGDFGDFIA